VVSLSDPTDLLVCGFLPIGFLLVNDVVVVSRAIIIRFELRMLTRDSKSEAFFSSVNGESARNLPSSSANTNSGRLTGIPVT